MKASTFTEAQQAFMLKQGEEGTPVAEICRKAGVRQETNFNWKKFGGLLPDEMRRLKQLEEPIIDIDDIADVVVAALTEEGHRGELYEVTGPRLMSFADMAAALSQATGRAIRHVPITFEAVHANIAEAGGDFVADVLAAIAREALDGRNARTADGVMRALSVTSGYGGAEAMQAINREVFRWVFMTLLLGLVPVSLFFVVYGGWVLGTSAGTLMALAGLVYVVGCFGVTAAFNVPMNTQLATLEVSSEAALDYWTGTYLPRWTFWNTVRTVACILSAALMLIALVGAARTQVASV